MINSPRRARRGDTCQALCRNNSDGLCPNGSCCPNDHSLMETMRMQRVAGNTHHRDAVVYVSIKYVNHGSWHVVTKVRAHQDNTGPFNAPTMLPAPLFTADQSLDRVLRKIESKMARRDAPALRRTSRAQVPSERLPPYFAVQAPTPADENYGTSDIPQYGAQQFRSTPTPSSPAYTRSNTSSLPSKYPESPFQ